LFSDLNCALKCAGISITGSERKAVAEMQEGSKETEVPNKLWEILKLAESGQVNGVFKEGYDEAMRALRNDTMNK
jgi:hypothetical protein